MCPVALASDLLVLAEEADLDFLGAGDGTEARDDREALGLAVPGDVGSAQIRGLDRDRFGCHGAPFVLGAGPHGPPYG